MCRSGRAGANSTKRITFKEAGGGEKGVPPCRNLARGGYEGVHRLHEEELMKKYMFDDVGARNVMQILRVASASMASCTE